MKAFTALVLSVLLLIGMLTGCSSKPIAPESETTPTTEATQPSSPAQIPSEVPDTTKATEAPTEPAPTEAPTEIPTEPPMEAADPLPYTLSLYGFIAIFDEPTYDGCYVQSVGQDGVYTIVEEQTDEEGNLWGKLKSGVGWVCLSELSADLPLIAGLGDASVLDSPHYYVNVDDSEFSEYIVFQPKSTLTDVYLTMLLPDVGGYTEDTLYDTIQELTPDTPLVVRVVFYGDFTTYGLSFQDETGTQRHFALYISGRNGAPVLQEYTP